MDWNDLLPAAECSYVLGNPPFVGKKEQSKRQKREVLDIFSGLRGAGTLDYVACWYRIATLYLQRSPLVEVGFVSTNSITQGEQVGILWGWLLEQGVQINFAHRTFEWISEARGKAHVHCVIIGFALHSRTSKAIYDYPTVKSEPLRREAQNINPYLVNSTNLLLRNRREALSIIPAVSYGSFALDDGNYTLTSKEKQDLQEEDSRSENFVLRFVGGRELIRGLERWCLWLDKVKPEDILTIKPIMTRVKAVQRWRSESGRKTTRELSLTPTCFAEIRQPSQEYLALPTASSIRRIYIPIAFLPPTVIASNQLYVIAEASVFHFGVLSSSMHMSWVRAVCGRIKSDYRYSAALVYNNFPWPPDLTQEQNTRIALLAQAVLNARALFPDSTLAVLYDPLLMPPELLKAHQALDRAVDRLYRPEPFPDDQARVEHLFALYEQLTAPLLPAASSRRPRAVRSSHP